MLLMGGGEKDAEWSRIYDGNLEQWYWYNNVTEESRWEEEEKDDDAYMYVCG